jgi:hypothetical protein
MFIRVFLFMVFSLWVVILGKAPKAKPSELSDLTTKPSKRPPRLGDETSRCNRARRDFFAMRGISHADTVTSEEVRVGEGQGLCGEVVGTILIVPPCLPRTFYQDALDVMVELGHLSPEVKPHELPGHIFFPTSPIKLCKQLAELKKLINNVPPDVLRTPHRFPPWYVVTRA